MASLMDLFARGSAPLGPMSIATPALNEADVTADEGLAQSRLLTNFGRANEGLRNRYASRGTWFSGQKGVQSDKLRDEYAQQSSDLTLARDRQKAAFVRNRALAAYGIEL
jgi:hypothetical protein